MRTYLHTTIVRAQPARNAMGRAGYTVFTPERSYFVLLDDFEREFRPVTRRENTLLKLTDGELGIAAITDEDYPDTPPE
jgi:hypothetical protein